jgi:hypothetical protein
MRQKMSDGHPAVDQREIAAQQVTDPCGQRQDAALHERYHGQRGERLAAARDADASADGHRDPVRPIGEAGGALDHRLVPAIDA